MPKFKIIYDKNGCIGAGPCFLAAPDFWHLEEDLGVGSKAVLHGSKINKKDDVFEKEIDENDLEKNLKAARECPAKCIRVIDVKTRKELI